MVIGLVTGTTAVPRESQPPAYKSRHDAEGPAWIRHGERTPTQYVYFPNESPPVRYTEAEPAELTNRGIQQAYERGEFIRNNYADFLGDVYLPSQIHVWSGENNRSVASAQALLAALYKPDNAHRWSNTLDWQPVAVHIDPTTDWVDVTIDRVCTTYKSKLFELPEYQNILNTFDPSLIDFLERNTGVAINSPLELNLVMDTLVTKLNMNDSRLPFPKWAEPIRDNVTELNTNLHQQLADAQRNTAGKYHAELLMSYIEDHVARQNSTRSKAVLISGHDTNFLAIGRQLNITPLANEMVPYASLLVVELHLVNGTYFVEDQRLNRVDWELKCRGIGPQMETFDILTASMILLIAVFVIAIVVLSCVSLSYRKQLKELKDPERRRLLPDYPDSVNAYA
ncbi:unnamed protein product [Angiostrongylus costaricensis]|uniref:Histidine acid phosphatase n=1 Tax=Angiostrongylus costaricensis TaxID=334426 RepID=A0A158PLZ8_ANGCS|nr:unnamed protein product [Angiostrongylus costaricensis]